MMFISRFNTVLLVAVATSFFVANVEGEKDLDETMTDTMDKDMMDMKNETMMDKDMEGEWDDKAMMDMEGHDMDSASSIISASSLFLTVGGVAAAFAGL
jgi:hypothetical protein